MKTTMKTINPDKIANVIFLAICAFAFSYYMQFEYILFKAVVVFVLLYFARKQSVEYRMGGVQLFVAAVLSLAISISLILGFHIHVESSYSGLVDTSYITDYHFVDWIAAALIMYGFFVIFRFLFSLGQGERAETLRVDRYRKIDGKRLAIYSAILFALWLPYLITYSPGYIFGDSLASIYQAMGEYPLNNAHPVLYTLLIRFCIWLGNLNGTTTTGIIIYSIIQMLYMAYGIGYLIHWLESTFCLKKYVSYVLLACFGCSPYIAQYGIAMWKDPIFSTTILLLTICIAEILLINMPVGEKFKWERKTIFSYLRFFFLLLLMIFSRNNGFYIVIALTCFAFLLLILEKNRMPYALFMGACLAAIIFSKIITGPVYERAGVDQSSEKVESYGVFLQQMARVVALNGELSANDSRYMASLLPLEQYVSTYTPCAVDNLKWNENFDRQPLDSGFFKTYFSILRKNPKLCFEAWELQTYGFWTLNQPAINQLDGNITGGVPRNIYTEYQDATMVQFKPVDETAWNVKVFPYRAKCVPVGYINWLLIILVFFAAAKKDWKILMILGASLGIMATLIIASPLSYWPRYGLAEQLLLPLYLILLLHVIGNKKIVKAIQ